MVTMENEQIPAPPPLSNPGATNTTATTAPSSSSSSGRQTGAPISVYSGIPDRQTVQVIQQALHRQPNTAAQYLQQMYAAQQQHLMLQTAALQQQHLGSSQLQSLAAIQQASLAANRQGVSPSSNGATQTPPQQPTINLATSPAAAQLINRAQSANSAAATASGIAQQAVLLGNSSNPTLSASQAQMYLRAQMAQQTSLMQVARSLGRAVPLSPQLIFTPTVAAVQPEGTSSSSMQPPTTTAPQVQNSALRTQQAVSQALSSSAGQPPSPAVAIKPALNNGSHSSSASPFSASSTSPAAQAKGAKEGGHELLSEHLRKGEGGGAGGSSNGTVAALDGRGSAPNRTGPPATTHALIAPAYSPAQTQPQPQQTKPLPHQFVIQQQLQPKPPHLQAFNTPAPSLNAPSAHLPSCQSPTQHRPNSSHTSPHLPGPPALGLQRTDGRPAGCPNHTAQPKFQHTSAVILQLQPPVGTLPLSVQEGPRKDPALLSPEAACTSLSAPPKPPPSEGTGPPPHEATPGSVRTPPDPSSPGMTSGNGSAASTVPSAVPQNGENKLPPQAIVKPQILTHLIEGFVIQEGAEPFPVGRSSLLVGNLKKKYAQAILAEKPQLQETTTDSEMEDPYLQESKDEEASPPKLKCELCGRLDFAYKFKRSKRFCSMACAKRYNVGCTKRVGLFHPDRSKLQKPNTPAHCRRRPCKGALPPLTKESKKTVPASLPPSSAPMAVPSSLQLSHGQEDSSRCSDNSSYEEPLSPISASSSASRRRQGERDMELPDVHLRDLVGMERHFLPSEPTKWNVEDVYEFIHSLPGCQEIADEFRTQEIDGQALLLLKEDHLMSAMNIKLGPALKIYARICMLKDS
ncbi:polyhomeotic-like protein 2 isoform X1 [Pantherophis guttatus]|uniref:Polyhomeotic-like protein 2 isoform X1 n=1 Tax=Pantherophis guttatus TaxID=94885 RepID=A0A6P9C7L2_PANGU|nr:polyhomeotic-like protein 2 isoform X1 [Pantherophis guttatus]